MKDKKHYMDKDINTPVGVITDLNELYRGKRERIILGIHKDEKEPIFLYQKKILWLWVLRDYCFSCFIDDDFNKAKEYFGIS